MANVVEIQVKATDQSAAALNSAAKNAQAAGTKISGVGQTVQKSFGAVFSSLQSFGGQALSPVFEAASGLESLGENFERNGKTISSSILAVGAAATISGGVLASLGSQETQAQNQLKNAIDNTGGSWDDYEDQIEAADSRLEKYGDTSAQTDQALQTLTNATHDPAKALDDIGEAADLAASKHISLNDAATLVAKGLDSKSKLYAQYGIQIQTMADGTANYALANEQLASILQGQASAASDTFSGHLKALGAVVEDDVAKFGQKYGPAITAAGAATSIAAGVFRTGASALDYLTDKFGSTSDAATAAAATQAEADATAGAADEARATQAVDAAATVTAADAEMAEAGEASTLAMGPLGLAIGAVAVVGGVAAGALGLFGDKEKAAAAPITDLTTQLEQQSGAFNNNTLAIIANQAQTKGLFTETDKLGISQAQLTQGLNSNSTAYQQNITQLKQIITAGTTYVAVGGRFSNGAMAPVLDKDAQAAQKALTTYQGLAGSVQASIKAESDSAAATATTNAQQLAAATALGETSSAYAAAQDAAEKQTQSTQTATQAMQAENDAAGLLKNALDALNDGDLSTAQAQTQLDSTLISTTATLKQNKGSLDEHTQAGVDDRQAIEQLVSSLQTKATADAKTMTSSQQATDAYNTQAKSLLTSIANTDGANSAAYQYAQQLLGIGKITVPVTQADFDDTQALAAITNFEKQLHAIPGTVITSEAVERSAAAGYAHGGIFATAATGGNREGTVTMNEQGIEAVHLPTGSTVLSHPDTMSKFGNGQPQQIVVSFDFGNGSDDLVQLMRKAVRVKGGGNVQAALGTG